MSVRLAVAYAARMDSDAVKRRFVDQHRQSERDFVSGETHYFAGQALSARRT